MAHWRVEIADTCELVKRLPTQGSAESFISDLEVTDPVRVHAGFYGITGPCADEGEAILNEDDETVTN